MKETAEQNDWPYDFGLVDIDGSMGSSAAVLEEPEPRWCGATSPTDEEPLGCSQGLLDASLGSTYFSEWFPREVSGEPPLEVAVVGAAQDGFVRFKVRSS